MKLNLKLKLLLGYMAMLLLIGIVGFFGNQGSTNMMSDYDSVKSNVIPKLGVSAEIKQNIVGQANDERGFLITGDDKYTKELLDKAAKTDDLIEKTIKSSDENDRNLLAQIETVHKEFTEINKQVIATYKQGKIEEAKKLSFTTGRDKRKGLDPLFAKLQKRIDTNLNESNNNIENNYQKDFYISIGTIVVAVLIALFFGVNSTK